MRKPVQWTHNLPFYLLTTSAQVNSITGGLNKTLLLEDHLLLLIELGSLGISATEVRHSLLLVTTVEFCENLLRQLSEIVTQNIALKVTFNKT